LSSLFSDTYNEIVQESETSLRERGSRFLAYSFKVFSESEVKEKLQGLKLKYPDATHHCYAYVIGQGQEAQRANDDGEPANSAGRPILRAIISADITHVLVVVVRYFGGTMLGIPGLIQAYGDAAKSVLLISEKIQEDIFEIIANFEHEQLIHQLLKPYDHRVLSREYLENVQYKVSVRRNQAMQFLSKAEEAYLLQVKSV
jgi:uncharacterized YigZ family protein